MGRTVGGTYRLPVGSPAHVPARRCDYCGAPGQRHVCRYCRTARAADPDYTVPAEWEQIDCLPGPPAPSPAENPGKKAWR